MAPQPPDWMILVALAAILLGILSPLFIPREVMDWIAGGGVLFIVVVLVIGFFRSRKAPQPPQKEIDP